jgi:2-oxoisovalerate dehydrogenase E2 component (dihydrolipoyl transacylase)
MKTFALPDLGEGLQEAEIVAWKVAVGDRVVTDQPLVAVETDKAIVEIPSPRAGRILKVFGDVGDVVRVGAALVEFEDDDNATADVGTIVGAIEHGADAVMTPHTGGRRIAEKRERGATGVRVRAAPAVRDLAGRLGVDLSRISGSGPHGAVTSDDVEHAATEKGYEPLRGTRRAMAVNMARAQAEVARTTVVDEADVEGWSDNADVTARLVRAIVTASRAEPALNAWYDARAVGRIVHDDVHLGVAVDTVDGLLVPVLRDAGSLDYEQVRRELDRLRTAAEHRSLTLQELRSPTITLSNFGMFAGRFASLMIVPPQVAIVGVGKMHRLVVASEQGALLHRLLPLSLTFDHRAVTGGEAARFLAALIEDLQRSA